jgi:hypothetical protein
MSCRPLPALLAWLFAASAAHAQLEWEKPLQEFHRSPEDNELLATFAFKNAGPSAIEINRVTTSCGCCRAGRAEKKKFMPGETGEIAVKFTFGGRRGEQRKFIAVSASDGREYSLELRCWIEDPLTISPALVFWRIGDATEAKTVELTAAHPSAMKITSVTSSSPRIHVVLLPEEKGASRFLRIEPADTTRKEIAQVTVQTDFPPDAPKSYVIHARVK